jgi:hypothetical protein
VQDCAALEAHQQVLAAGLDAAHALAHQPQPARLRCDPRLRRREYRYCAAGQRRM